MFLYTHYDEYDQAANTMMALSSVVFVLRIETSNTDVNNWYEAFASRTAHAYTRTRLHSKTLFLHLATLEFTAMRTLHQLVASIAIGSWAERQEKRQNMT